MIIKNPFLKNKKKEFKCFKQSLIKCRNLKSLFKKIKLILKEMINLWNSKSKQKEFPKEYKLSFRIDNIKF